MAANLVINDLQASYSQGAAGAFQDITLDSTRNGIRIRNITGDPAGTLLAVTDNAAASEILGVRDAAIETAVPLGIQGAPSSPLHVTEATASTIGQFTKTDSGPVYLTIENSTNIWSLGQDAGEVWQVNDVTGGTSPIQIETGAADDMIHIQADRVGINQSSPGNTLEVSSGGSTVAEINTTGTTQFAGFQVANNVGGQNYFAIVGSSSRAGTLFGLSQASLGMFYANNIPFVLGTQNAFDLTLGTADTARVTITSTGEVGVGTDSPASLFHVEDQTATSGGTVAVATLDRDAGTGAIGDGTALDLALSNDAGDSTTALRISAEWVDPTDGSEDVAVVFSGIASGIFTEALRFVGDVSGLATDIRTPLALNLHPNGDNADGLLLTTIASNVYMLPVTSTNDFYLGNTTADPSVDLNRSTARALSLVPLGTTVTTASPAEWVNFGSLVTMDYANSSIGGLVSATGTFEFAQAGGTLGAGNLFKNAATFKNVNAVTASFGSQYTFVNTATYQADGASISSFFWRNCLFQTQWDVINAGTLAITTVNQGGFINPNVGAGVTITNMRDWEWGAGTVSGTVTSRDLIHWADVAGGSTRTAGIYSLINSGTGRALIRHEGTAPTQLGGTLDLGVGTTFDWTISRVAANLASLADGDSLRITTGNLFFGAAGSVNLAEGAANRLDLASGDSLRIVSGTLQFAGTAEQISRTAGELLLTAAQVRTSADLEIDGTLDHDGTTVGFYGTAPAVQPTVTGSRGGNAALASLLTSLAGQGLIVDGSSA